MADASKAYLTDKENCDQFVNVKHNEREIAGYDKPPGAENLTSVVPLNRRHSTGGFVIETASDDEHSRESHKFKIHKQSKQSQPNVLLHNVDAIKCSRFPSRRNALCDPFRMLLPQRLREQLENKVERRKTSVKRKISQFFTVSLDLNREEELI